VAATEAEECVWVLDPCPQVEGANYDWFVLAAGRGGRLWIEGRCVGSAARAGPAARIFGSPAMRRGYQDLGRQMWM